MTCINVTLLPRQSRGLLELVASSLFILTFVILSVDILIFRSLTVSHVFYDLYKNKQLGFLPFEHIKINLNNTKVSSKADNISN